MQLVSINAIIAMLWMSTVSVAGIAANVNSFPGWMFLGVVAVIPPFVMRWRWRDPTMSEAIQEVLR